MKFAIKSIVATAAFIAVGAASAAPVTLAAGGINNNVQFLSGAGSLSFSADLLGALDTGKVAVAGYGAATATVTKDADGYYIEASASAPSCEGPSSRSRGWSRPRPCGHGSGSAAARRFPRP